jgi:hypothetical protein
MKTISEIRASFWASYPEFKKEYRTKKRQNDYKTDIRCAFVDYIDNLQRNGDISEKLAHRATL